MLSEKDRKHIWSCIESEVDFEYTFISYSSFDKVKDKKFHELRKAYIQAHKDLEDYLGKSPFEEE